MVDHKEFVYAVQGRVAQPLALSVMMMERTDGTLNVRSYATSAEEMHETVLRSSLWPSALKRSCRCCQ